MSRPRVAIVGGGVAGVVLAWRLRQAGGVDVDLFLGTRTSGSTGADTQAGGGRGAGAPAVTDATAASGGMVRAFEVDAGACRLAAESLAELRDDAELRRLVGFRRVGSVYLLPPGADPAGSVETVDRVLPGSARPMTVDQLVSAGYPFRDLPGGTIGIVERYAGYLSPALMRDRLVERLAAAPAGAGAGPSACTVRAVAVAAVTAATTVTPTVRPVDGPPLGYDVVVVAAGPWTPRLLAASGLPTDGLRTRQIQYVVTDLGPADLPAFVDDTGDTGDAGGGLYGRPAGDGRALLGLPTPHWQVDPDAVIPDAELVDRTLAEARRRLGVSVDAGPTSRVVASSDCYHDPAGLALRRVGGHPALLTFTGGSGGAAKTVLAAARVAATALVHRLAGVGAGSPR